MRTLTALVVLAAIALAIRAQEAAAVDFTSYGGTGLEAAQKVAGDLNAELRLNNVSEDDLDLPCFAVSKGVSRADLPELLSIVLGHPVSLSGGRLHVFLPQSGTPAGRVKGYDVSVPAGRFVEYVNTYGAPRTAPRPGEEPAEQRTAAEHLANVLDDLLYESRGPAIEASVVGDRLLYTLDDAGHARVREALDLLIAEKGGESANLQAERQIIDRLKQAKFKGDLTATPASSVISLICAAASVGVVLGRDLGAMAVEWHIDFVQETEVSAWDALQRVFEMLRQQEYPVEFTARGGAVAIELEGSGIRRGYRVYEVTDLLKKLTASYQRQRTVPNKEEGFEGDVRAAGGSGVIVDALDEQLSASGVGAVQLEPYGARLIVRGSTDEVDRATAILKEMGWEE